MARSADHRLLGLAAAALVLPVLAGCDSTFQQNGRAEIAATRRLAAKEAVNVAERGADVRVERVTLLRDGSSTAVVADLRNRGAQALTDVPISVGVRRGSAKVLLNDAADLDWWQTHLASIAAGGRATWVFQSPPGGRAQPGDTPFVRVGDPDPKLGKHPSALPTITATVSGPLARTTKVELTSASVPQLGLPVSVVARKDGVPVAAGTTTVELLERDHPITVDVPLTGRAGSAPATVVTTPTIFE